MNINKLSNIELLKLQSSILHELKQRDVVRTKNNPVVDYTEWLVSKALNLELAANSKSGYDGIDQNGIKIQIKSRRITAQNKSRQLSAIRNYEKNDFDILVAIIYNENYEIVDAVQIPHDVIGEYAKYRPHVNAYILHLNSDILNDPRIISIKEVINRYHK